MDYISKVRLEDLPEVSPIERRLRTPKQRRQWSPTPSASTSQITPIKRGRIKLVSETPDSAIESMTESPSPAKPVDRSNNLRSPPKRARRRLDFPPPLNYGSEDEDFTGDEEDLPTIPIPKSLRTMIKTALDVEEQPKERSVSPPSVPSSLNRVDGTDLGEYKPTDMYDFQWQPFPKSPIPWNLRRETFKDNNPGPKVHYADPYDAFVAIWDRQIMEHICKQTNLYVQQMIERSLRTGGICPQSRITRWKDIDVDELYVYFSVIIAMGVVVKSRIEEYWSNNNKDIFTTPAFSIYMPVNRFMLINRWLHFNNNFDIDFSQLSRGQAKLYKLQPIIDHLNKKFSTLYSLSQNIALDESLTQWKGLLDIKQFISNKAAGEGIKTYEICESQTGYTWRFETHCGFKSSQNSGPVSGAIASTVLRLVKGLEFKGHTLWMDNYYNSPALARTLKSLQIDCVGTLRTNRRFVPAQLSRLTMADMAKNEIVGCTSGDVDLFVWRDKKCLGLISTYHGNTITRCGEVVKPTLIHDYNLCMGGVDKKDQMLSLYPIERKRTRVWYKKFFRRLVNVSVLNSFIMHKFNTPTSTHRDFRLELVRQLLEIHHPENTKLIKILPTSGTKKFSAEMLRHLPAKFVDLRRSKTNRRRKCVICKDRTRTYCPGCSVALCAFKSASANTPTCFQVHHS